MTGGTKVKVPAGGTASHREQCRPGGSGARSREHSEKKPVKNKGGVKTFSRLQRRKEFITSGPVLQEI